MCFVRMVFTGRACNWHQYLCLQVAGCPRGRCLESKYFYLRLDFIIKMIETIHSGHCNSITPRFWGWSPHWLPSSDMGILHQMPVSSEQRMSLFTPSHLVSMIKFSLIESNHYRLPKNLHQSRIGWMILARHDGRSSLLSAVSEFLLSQFPTYTGKQKVGEGDDWLAGSQMKDMARFTIQVHASLSKGSFPNLNYNHANPTIA